MGRVANAFFGGWSLSGLFHWTTGLPFRVFVMFQDPIAVRQNAFRHPYPGEGGQRNELRGPGYFGIDTGFGKQWSITEQQKLKLAREIFNITNAVRFDATLSSNSFDLSSSGFGVYSSTLTKPRVMQFSLRYSV
jgi:hypothetical protein